MICPLTDTELNAWCAELCGVSFGRDTDGAEYYFMSDGLEMYADWSPCLDRCQAQLVVEKMADGSINLREMFYKNLTGRLPEDEWDGWSICLTPRQICEAAWEACNGN